MWIIKVALPCKINILSEDDIIIEFDINCVSMVFNSIQLHISLYWVCLYSVCLNVLLSLLVLKLFINTVIVFLYFQFKVLLVHIITNSKHLSLYLHLRMQSCSVLCTKSLLLADSYQCLADN